MIPIYRLSQRLLLLIFTATVCVFFIRRRFTDDDYENDILDSTFRASVQRRISYVDLRNLSYSTDSAPRCNFDSPYLLILVHSAPAHFSQRSTIRKTWGSLPNILEHSIRVVFLLGEVKGIIGTKVHREMNDHNDVVKGNFDDSYKNLTYKHILGYKWFLSNCERVSVVMKVDDDVFVEVFRTVDFFTKTFGSHPANLLIGVRCPSMSVLREGKWSVPKEEYPFDTYPDFLSGFAYLFSPDVASKLYSAIEKVPFFWIDDVFMTGLVADAAGVVKTDLKVRFALRGGYLIRWLLGNSTRPSPWIASEMELRHWPQDIHRLWTKTVKTWAMSSLS